LALGGGDMPLHMIDSVKRIVVGSVPGDVTKQEYFKGILEQAFGILKEGNDDITEIVEGILIEISKEEREIYIDALGFGCMSLNADGEEIGLNERFNGLHVHGTDLDDCEILRTSDDLSCSLALCKSLSPGLLTPILPILLLLVVFKHANPICNIVSLEDCVLKVARAGVNDQEVVKSLVDGVLSRLAVSMHASGASDGGIQLVAGEKMIEVPENVIKKLVLDEVVGPVLLLELFDVYGAGGDNAGKAASVVMVGLGDGGVVERISKDATRMLAFCRGVIGGGDEGMLGVALGIVAITFTMEDGDVLLGIAKEVIDVLEKVVTTRVGDLLDRAVDARQAVLSYVSRHTKSENGEGESSHDILDESLRDLADAEIPNRAHGMSRIKDLVLARDPVIVTRLSSVMDLYLQQLIHPDR
jgi:hypothetical protein